MQSAEIAGEDCGPHIVTPARRRLSGFTHAHFSPLIGAIAEVANALMRISDVGGSAITRLPPPPRQRLREEPQEGAPPPAKRPLEAAQEEELRIGGFESRLHPMMERYRLSSGARFHWAQ
jgi:hypothetical protein